jgi:uncharacterized damage-inducible protein DinB
MTRDEAKQLFDYGVWANALFFRVAEGLTREQAEAPAAGSFPSIVGTLGHIVSAEWVWLRRWLGESPAAMPEWVTRPSVAELKDKLAAVEAERGSFLAGLSEEDLDRVVSYRTLAGQAYSDPLGHLVRHVVNHSTYHRGQLVAQLRQLGQTPPNTDLIRYLRESK